MSDKNETPESTPGRSGWTPPARKSRRGMSKRLKHSLDAHAETESERRQAHQKTGTPKRDDVGRAVLHAMLLALHRYPEEEGPQNIRRHVIGLLGEALFNEAEAERVIADMIIRAEHDFEKWIYVRVFRMWRDGGCRGPGPSARPILRGRFN